METLISDSQYLNKNHLSFLFLYLGFDKIYRKIIYMAKYLSDLGNFYSELDFGGIFSLKNIFLLFFFIDL